MNISPVIQVTDAAIKHIKTIIAKRGSGMGFRISIKQTGCSGYMYVPEIIEKENKEDVLVDTEKNLKIYLARDCVDMIRGTTLDFVEKNLGMKQLQFNNPNVEGLCGCGESFHLKNE